ncbi:MAG: cell division protein SepF, partial [Symbiobacteriaceae bacterium]|nr:cell division protein SepF [Symbiobacteriaceae bacterium]
NFGLSISYPKKPEDFADIVRDIRSGRSVLICLETMEPSSIDIWLSYLYGAAVALDAQFERISEGIYTMLPMGVDVTSNCKEIYLARDNQERGREARVRPKEGFVN